VKKEKRNSLVARLLTKILERAHSPVGGLKARPVLLDAEALGVATYQASRMVNWPAGQTVPYPEGTVVDIVRKGASHLRPYFGWWVEL
jgi:hypothetical protein